MKYFLKFWVTLKKDFVGKLNIWWDIGKMKIRNRCKKFSKRLAKEKREKRTTFEEKLQRATISPDQKEKEIVPLISEKLMNSILTTLMVHVSEQKPLNSNQMRNLPAIFSALRIHVNKKKGFVS